MLFHNTKEIADNERGRKGGNEGGGKREGGVREGGRERERNEEEEEEERGFGQILKTRHCSP